jgi:hypothetical protein
VAGHPVVKPGGNALNKQLDVCLEVWSDINVVGFATAEAYEMVVVMAGEILGDLVTGEPAWIMLLLDDTRVVERSK